jgi:hypothetical protein
MDVLQRPDWYGSPVHLGELFMVRKNNVEARCVVRSHRLGWELYLQVGLNRDFTQTKVCRDTLTDLATAVQSPGNEPACDILASFPEPPGASISRQSH